jgi:hypothetical protein
MNARFCPSSVTKRRRFLESLMVVATILTGI